MRSFCADDSSCTTVTYSEDYWKTARSDDCTGTAEVTWTASARKPVSATNGTTKLHWNGIAKLPRFKGCMPGKFHRVRHDWEIDPWRRLHKPIPMGPRFTRHNRADPVMEQAT